MKKVLSLLAGMVFVLAFGLAYADDMMQESKETGEKMIRDQDLQKYEQDQEKSTVTQMPSVPGEGGSAAGGTGEPGSAPMMEDTSEKPAPAEKEMTTPSDDTGPAMKEPVQEMKDRY